MAVLLLPNTIGAVATGISISGCTLSTGYDNTHLLSGPRHRHVRTEAGTQHNLAYTCGSTAVTHVVVTSADLFKNGENSVDINVLHGVTVDSTTVVGSMTMVGPKNQDWVNTIAQTDTSFGVRFDHSSSEANMTGKIYFADDFDFGTAPQLVNLERAADLVRPLTGYQAYQTERRITLRWDNVSQTTMAAFRALALFWPFFIYDENSDIFDHKLEHVLISEPWRERRRQDGSYSIDLTVRRLKYYDR